MSSLPRDGTKPKQSGDQRIIDDEAERRKKIEQDVRIRQECEKKAFKIVEKMLENPVTEDTLLQDAQYICPSHYDDITEERAIARLCGYPICLNSLGPIPKQKYHISTRSNKVYDITVRKNFCSNQCFTASQYFRRQLLTAPLWTRKHVNDKPFKLLPREATSGLEGDEVISIQTELRQEVQSLERLEKYEAKSKDKSASKASNDPDMLNLQSLRITDSNTSSNQGISGSATLSHSKSSRQKDSSVNSDEKEEIKSEIKDDSTENNPNQNSKTKTESGHHGDTMNAEAKMKHLQILLNKRKHLLGKLADIQPVKLEMSNTKLSHDSDDDDNEEDSESGKDQRRITKRTTKDSEDNIDPASANVTCANVKPANFDICHNHELPVNVSKTDPTVIKQQLHPTEVSHSTALRQQERQNNPKIPTTPSKSVIMILCQTMKQWVTEETIDLISPKESDTPQDGIDNLEFQSKYEQLCRRIDNSENDLDDLIGESKMEDSSIPQQSVPDYRKLKAETEEFGNKVAHYLQGKTALVVKEKDVEEKSVHLPTVDSHDQMLIRKKIVMEKLSRLMPEVLTPLKLSMQEVFSEIRQLVSTFRLGSQNIIFRPAEWTLVSLILIKMLARKQQYMAEACKEESAVRYFDILLRSIHESEATVDQHISKIIFS